MDTALIRNIEITTNNREIIPVSPQNFSNLYVANLDENGDEINYDEVPNSRALGANFFMIKIKKENNQESYLAQDRLYSRKDIIKVTVTLINGLRQEFELSKRRVVDHGPLENQYETTFMQDEDLCIVVSDKKVKYLENLFA